MTNGVAALHALEYVGYYHLLIYMRPLQQQDPSKGVRMFVPGTTFEDVLRLYDFDRQLRILCIDAVERIEVALRAAIVSEVAVPHGSHFYVNSAHFEWPGAFHDFQNCVADARQHHTVQHYYATYSTPAEPPIWAVMEAVTFGALSRLFSGLTRSLRKAIAKRFGFDEKVLRSWFRATNGLRNVAAHHGRLWNAAMHVNQPMTPTSKLSPLAGVKTDKFYARAVVLGELLCVVDPNSDWKNKLIKLLDDNAFVNAQSMGFPSGWRALPFWV